MMVLHFLWYLVAEKTEFKVSANFYENTYFWNTVFTETLLKELFRLSESRLQYNKNVPTVKPMARTSWRIMGIHSNNNLTHDTVPWTEQ